MLNSRSTRIAAILLLTLLFGWVVRAQRKGGTHALPPMPTPPPAAVPETSEQSVLNNE
jgi:hypothetical protein